MKKTKAIILDLDGTLLDTVPDLVVAHNRCLRALGLPERRTEEFGKIIGGGLREAIQKACPAGTAAEELERYYKLYREFYHGHCTVFTRHYPGMPELLRACRAAGITVAALTNKSEDTAIRMITHFFPEIDFAFIWGNDGVRPLKPAPGGGEEACAFLGIEPGEAMYVGDSDTDMIFANAVGMAAVGAVWGYRGYEELKNAGAGFLPATPAELSEILFAET